MAITRFLRKLYFRLIRRPQCESSDAYISWLRKNGIKVGNGTIVRNPQNIQIDISRPALLEIGEHVLLHNGTVIMTHDYASRTFVTKYNDFIPSHGKITIGNNVWLGEHVTILKNVTIGDNVIIGAGSIVTKPIPSNSIAVGCPAKVIGTFESYYAKRQKEYINEAIDYAIAIYESGRKPTVEDFYDDYPAFVDGSNYKDYDYPYSRVFTPEQFNEWIKNHRAPFHGFDAFMAAVDERRKEND